MGMTWEQGGNGELMMNISPTRCFGGTFMHPTSSIDAVSTFDSFTAIDTTMSIEMVSPAQVCTQLCLDEQRLLDMVNDGQLAAYDFGGEIRFKTLDVVAAIALLSLA